MRGSNAPRRLRVALSRERHRELRAALIRAGDKREHGAFLFAKPQSQQLIEVIDFELLQAVHFESQGFGYLELRDGALQEMLLRAHRSETALIEAHSHPFSIGPGVSFSPFDEEGLSEVAPHIVWRLPGRPYVALVFGQQSFDGLFWSNAEQVPAGAVDLVVGGELLFGSGQSLDRWGGKS